VAVRRLAGFEEPGIEALWQRLLDASPAAGVFQTLEWQRTWWRAFGRGWLRLLLAERDGRPVALLPLFADGGLGYLVGAGQSDGLDLVGEVADEEALAALLRAAVEEVPGFLGLRFHLVRDDSPTGVHLAGAARLVRLATLDEGAIAAPALDLSRGADAVTRILAKDSVRRHEAWFARRGGAEFEVVASAAEAIERLPGLFSQAEARWKALGRPGPLAEPRFRWFLERLVESAAPRGWVRLARLLSQGSPAAHLLAFSWRRRWHWYLSTFDPGLGKGSPGEVLLARAIRAAAAEGAERFEFGLGEEPYKVRFATSRPTVRTWGLYPASA
jgi:CelD/BcsL family acetyltransferase involved in cellulose biosynthesis